jgi:hypothetical protein
MTEPVHRYELKGIEDRLKRLEEARLEDQRAQTDRYARYTKIMAAVSLLVAYSVWLCIIAVRIAEKY